MGDGRGAAGGWSPTFENLTFPINILEEKVVFLVSSG